MSSKPKGKMGRSTVVSDDEEEGENEWMFNKQRKMLAPTPAQSKIVIKPLNVTPASDSPPLSRVDVSKLSVNKFIPINPLTRSPPPRRPSSEVKVVVPPIPREKKVNSTVQVAFKSVPKKDPPLQQADPFWSPPLPKDNSALWKPRPKNQVLSDIPLPAEDAQLIPMPPVKKPCCGIQVEVLNELSEMLGETFNALCATIKNKHTLRHKAFLTLGDDLEALHILLTTPYKRGFEDNVDNSETIVQILSEICGRFPPLEVKQNVLLEVVTEGFIHERKKAIHSLIEVGDFKGLQALFNLERERLGADYVIQRLLLKLHSAMTESHITVPMPTFQTRTEDFYEIFRELLKQFDEFVQNRVLADMFMLKFSAIRRTLLEAKRKGPSDVTIAPSTSKAKSEVKSIDDMDASGHEICYGVKLNKLEELSRKMDVPMNILLEAFNRKYYQRKSAIQLLDTDEKGILALLTTPFHCKEKERKVSNETIVKILGYSCGRFRRLECPASALFEVVTDGFTPERKRAIQHMAQIGDAEGVETLYAMECKTLGSQMPIQKMLRHLHSILSDTGHVSGPLSMPAVAKDYSEIFDDLMKDFDESVYDRIRNYLFTANYDRIRRIVATIKPKKVSRPEAKETKQNDFHKDLSKVLAIVDPALDSIIESFAQRRQDLVNSSRAEAKIDEFQPEIETEPEVLPIGEAISIVTLEREPRNQKKATEKENDTPVSSLTTLTEPFADIPTLTEQLQGDVQIDNSENRTYTYIVEIPQPAVNFNPCNSLCQLADCNPSLDLTNWRLDVAELNKTSQKLTITVDGATATEIANLDYFAVYGTTSAYFSVR